MDLWGAFSTWEVIDYDGACIGDISGFVKNRIGGAYYQGTDKQRSYAGVSMDISHTHTINPDGGNEARPANYTMRIWVRTA